MSHKNDSRTPYSFWRLLEQHSIVIPTIQRDYAHGRDDARSVRETFIRDLVESLKASRPHHMDFVFGTVDEKGRLIPIDGQQRLTFLFLVHCYAALRAGKAGEAKERLQKFSYEVRETSRDFVARLVAHLEEMAAALSEESLSQWVEDQPWFLPQWRHDPTVRSMLVVLDDLHKRAREENLQNWGKIWENLVEKGLVTFDFLDMEGLSLSDELYVLMNARGKRLTGFEVFKARFLQHLQRENFQDVDQFQQKMDGEWLDHLWRTYGTSVLEGEKTPGQVAEEATKNADQAFLNFLWFFLEMLAYRNRGREESVPESTPEKADKISSLQPEDLLPLALRKQEDLNLLVHALDSLPEAGNDPILALRVFWTDGGRLFQPLQDGLDRVMKSYHDTNKRPAYGLRILLFLYFLFLWIYSLWTNRRVPKEAIRENLRIARNLLNRMGTRGFYSFDQRINEDQIPALLRLFERHFPLEGNRWPDGLQPRGTGITEESFRHEREKREWLKHHPDRKEDLEDLEDHVYLQGDLRNLWTEQGPLLTSEQLSGVFGDSMEIQRVWKATQGGQAPTGEKRKKVQEFVRRDGYLAAVLLSFTPDTEDAPYPRKDTSRVRRFFGRTGYWHVLLTDPEMKDPETEKNIWVAFFRALKEKGMDLRELWRERKELFKDLCDWKYYYVHYPDFYDDILSLYAPASQEANQKHEIFRQTGGRDANLFVWPSPSPFLAEKNRTMGKTSEHVSPFLYVVWKRLKKPGEEGVRLHTGDGAFRQDQKAYFSHLELPGKFRVQMTMVDKGEDAEKRRPAWKITVEEKFADVFRENLEHSPRWGKRIRNEQDGIYLLPCNDRDMIQELIDFLNLFRDSDPSLSRHRTDISDGG